MLRTFRIYFSLQFLGIFIHNILSGTCFSLNHEIEIIEYNSIALCIVEISKSELFWRPTAILQTEDHRTTREEKFIDEILTQLAINNIPYIVIDTVDNATLDESDASYIFIGYFAECQEITAFNFDGFKSTKYLLIIESYSNICEQYFESINDSVGKYDVSFYVKISKNDYILNTFIPDIDPISCKSVNRRCTKMNTCSENKELVNNAFQHKISTDYKKCPFKVGMGTLYPFALIKNKTELKTFNPLRPDRIKGSDLEIIKIMTDYFKATLELYYINKEEENPYVNTEYLQFLINGSLEACAGGLYRIYGDLVEYSGIYERQTVMWIYSAERSIKNWKNMVMSMNGLYLFFVFYLIYSFMWCFICFFDKNSVSFTNTLLHSWGALVGTTSLQNAISLKQKILNIVYLNMCLHLSVYISIQLYSFLTIRGPPEMFKTNDDIMNSGRTAYLKTLTKYFVKDEKYERFANTSKECAGFRKCAEISLKNKGVTVMVQGYFYPLQALTAVNDEARMLSPRDSLLTVYNEMIIRKESPLVLKFQRITRWLFEAGITNRLFKEAIGLNIISKAKSATKNMVTSSYACQAGCKISLGQFSGMFYVWGFGCMISCFVFILEISKRRNIVTNRFF